MKKLVLAAALSGVASFAAAGNMEEPMMEPEVIIETVEEAGSSNGLIIPLIIIALIAVAAS
ncbi:MAG: hypothetical protein AAF714_11420 [Pseudomonadota bacterium]